MKESSPQSDVPEIRIRVANQAKLRSDGDYVLYWMIANRRTHSNFSLQRAVDWAKALKQPLLIFEALRCDYPWASDRLHRFVIQGMADNAADLARKQVSYFPYLERAPGEGKGLLAALASRACVVVSDDFPCFFLPKMVRAAGKQIPVRFELIDSNGLLPMRAAEKVFSRAYDFRRHLQKNLLPHLLEIPKSNPFAHARLAEMEPLSKEIQNRWPTADLDLLLKNDIDLSSFPINHHVGPAMLPGGSKAANKQLTTFLKIRLPHYATSRNQSEQEVASGLSPYLHFGHISSHQVFETLVQQENWSPSAISKKGNGSATGWWGTSEAAESFLDELITWRELGYNMCSKRSDYAEYASLPNWAQQTLEDHAKDPREFLYRLERFETAQTHDPLWNAAQRQLVREGRMHNYLRMLWGKKILEWSKSPQDALQVMIELNNKYALDGRNPNSYSGIFWVLGRYDRAWGPERPIFGKIRYMSSENTARKLKVAEYLKQYAAEPKSELLE